VTEQETEWEGPGEHDSHLMDDDPSETVACAKCGKQIWAYAQKCHLCGVNFQGEAWQFEPKDVKDSVSGRMWVVVIVVLIVAMLIFLF